MGSGAVGLSQALDLGIPGKHRPSMVGPNSVHPTALCHVQDLGSVPYTPVLLIILEEKPSSFHTLQPGTQRPRE
jgi:hypothetical protein